MDEIKVRSAGSNEIELVVPRTITGTSERLIEMLGHTIRKVKDEDVRGRAEAFIRDEPDLARAVAKIIEESRLPASLIEAGTITGATIVSPNYIGPIHGRSGLLSLDPSSDGVTVRLCREDRDVYVGRWSAEYRVLRLTMADDTVGLVEVEQAVRAMCQVRDVQRVRVALSNGGRVIFQRGGTVECVVGAPGAQRYAFARDGVIIPGEHTLCRRFGVEVPSEAVRVAEAIMRGMYA